MAERPPLVRKVPSWQPVVGFLVAAAAFSVTLYGHHDLVVRILLGAIGVGASAGAVVALRAYLVVDDEGIGWRRLSRETSISWEQIKSVLVTRTKLQVGIAVLCTDGRVLSIPPVLILPSKPMKNLATVRVLDETVRDILARRP